MRALSLSCLQPCSPMDCSPFGSSVHGISQARILEWVTISSSRRSSRPRDWTWVSCTAGRFFTAEPPGKPITLIIQVIIFQPQQICTLLINFTGLVSYPPLIPHPATPLLLASALTCCPPSPGVNILCLPPPPATLDFFLVLKHATLEKRTHTHTQFR